MKRILIRGALILAPLAVLGAVVAPRAGTFLVVQDPLEKADAIIVLGGSMYERPLEAVDLYNAGWASRIYLIREMADWGEVELIKRGVPYTTIVGLQIDTLVKVGMPRDVIGVLEPSVSTAHESWRVRQLVTEQQLARIIIVTSQQHTRRTRLVMNRRLRDLGTRVIVRASKYDRSDVVHWWRDRATLRFTLFEMQRLFGYWIGAAD